MTIAASVRPLDIGNVFRSPRDGAEFQIVTLRPAEGKVTARDSRRHLWSFPALVALRFRVDPVR